MHGFSVDESLCIVALRLSPSHNAQFVGPSAQDCRLVSLAEKYKEQYFGHGGKTNADPDDLSPARRLCDKSCDRRTDSATQQRGQHNDRHGRASGFGGEHIADDGRIQHITRHRAARQKAGGDQQSRTLTQRPEHRARDEQAICQVKDWISTIDLRHRRYEQRPSGFTQFSDGNQQDTSCGGALTATGVVQVGDDVVGHGH